MTIIVYDAETGDIEEAAAPTDYAAKEKTLREQGKVFETFPFMKVMASISVLRYDRETGKLAKRSETLAELRAPLMQRLKQHHGLAAQAKIEIGGHVFDGDARAQTTAAAFAVRVRVGQKAPHGGFWRLADNSEIPFTDEEVLALDAALAARNAEMQRRAWELAKAIRDETDAVALKAFDLAAAWEAAA